MTQLSNVAQHSQCDSECPAMEFVEGGRPQSLSTENHHLLASRMQTASLLLCAGFTAFFIRSLFSLSDFDDPIDWLLLLCHAGMIVLTGLVGVRLVQGCKVAMKHVYAAEVLVFGGSAIFFALLNFRQISVFAEREMLPPVAVPWLLLIFTYGMYIPNTWKRAAALIAPMAAAPVLILLIASLAWPQVSKIMGATPPLDSPLLEIGMVTALAGVISVWGVDRMNAMRSEVHEMQRLGQYRLKKLLGSGGMGEVYLAEHLLLKRPCALKLIRPEKAGDPQSLARFEREVRANAKLTHWNTVEIFDYGHAADGTFYYVMEYLPGKNLDELVTGHGPMPAARIIHLLQQTCDALEEAHGLGLIHRDIKPANIFAAQRGGQYDVAKLLDFGLVRTTQSSSEEDIALTQLGVVTGSPLFLSPEQALGEHLDGRSDIYSLGAVAWYLLTGRPPFLGDNVIKVILAHAHQQVEPPSRFNPEIPADLEAVVMKCLSKRPDDRYASAGALRDALLACQDAENWTRDDAAAWWQSTGRWQQPVVHEQNELNQQLAVTIA